MVQLLHMTETLVLQDFNASHPCEFPDRAGDEAVIVNPCNSDEIFVFSTRQSYDILIYNRLTNKTKVIQPNNMDLFFDAKSSSNVYVFGGNRKNTVIVIWTSRFSNNLQYSVFNCQTMYFEVDVEIGIQIESDDDDNLGRPILIQTINKINNLLFVICNRNPILVFVFDTINQNSPTQMNFYQIDTANIRKDTYKRYVNQYKSIMYVDKDNINIYNIILVGNMNPKFSESFYHVTIDIFQDDSNIKFLKEWNIGDKIAAFNKLDKRCVNFSCHWYKSRYLMIVGGSYEQSTNAYDGKMSVRYPTDRLLCFDCVKKQWYIDSYKLANPIANHASLLLYEKNQLCLYIFAHNTYGKKTCSKLNLLKKLDWKIERLIWIGYYKNNCNNQDSNVKGCKLSNLGKDVVLHILSFVKRQFLFE